MTEPLETFEDRDVLQTKIKVTNAGDGLSAAVGVDPQLLHLDQVVYVVLETRVAKVQHLPTKDAPDVLAREHTLKTTGATIVGADLVAALVNEQKDRVQKAKEAAQGVQRLDLEHEGGEPDDDE